METTKEGPLNHAHGLVHDICFNLGKDDQDTAKELLKELDIFLHDAINGKQGV